MNLEELLKQLGHSDDAIKAIMDGMKENKIYTSAEENMDIRYPKLKEQHDALTKQHEESTKLIAELQKATKGNEAIQAKVAEYEATIAKQNKELQQARTESALKIGLLSAGAKAGDIDYLLFKMSHDTEWKAELDEDGQIKGLDDKVKGLKTQFPGQFESASSKKIEEKKLDKGDEGTKITQEEFNKMGYQSRLKLINENPELYSELNSKKG